MTTKSEQNSTCCPEFDPTLWDDKLIDWKHKKFIKDRVCTLFYMPVNFGHVMRRLNKVVTDAAVTVPDWLCLSDHTSKWNMDIYLAVGQEIPGVQVVELSGRFYCKVYEGPFRDTEKWCTDFESTIKSKEYPKNKVFMWYTTCPKCAKKYGKNYVAILSQVESIE